MSDYIRPRTSGATIFFTVNLANRSSDLLVREVDGLRDAFMRTISDRRFYIDAVVILPDHLHMVMTLPDGDSDYATRWRVIKARFSRGVNKGRVRGSHVRRCGRGGMVRGDHAPYGLFNAAVLLINHYSLGIIRNPSQLKLSNKDRHCILRISMR